MLVMDAAIQKIKVGLIGFFEISNQSGLSETEKKQGSS
jgi:hypothetical protein